MRFFFFFFFFGGGGRGIEEKKDDIKERHAYFTVGSLKASRTETGIATATIAIKTCCVILTRVTGTGQNFCSVNVWEMKERE